MCEGDANTRFFHTSTINRRSRNMIQSSTNEVGNQIKDPQHINETIMRYFSKLFTTSHVSSYCQTSCNVDISLVLSDKVRASIALPLRSFEIKKAIDSFKPIKFLGPDGLHPFFYQKYWHVISIQVTNLCHKVFSTSTMPLK